MPICPNCGVELAETEKNCPLCRTALHDTTERIATGATYPEKVQITEDFETLPASDKRKVFLEVFSVCSLIASLVVLAVELIISRKIWWSLYPIVSIGYIYILVCVPIFFTLHRWRVLALLVPATPLYLFLIALVSNGMAWFLPIGLPIVLVAETALILCVVLVIFSKRKGVNVIAIVLSGISIICAGIETVLNLYFQQRFLLSWSAVVATACLSVAVFLFYLHYRFNKGASLKKLFHL